MSRPKNSGEARRRYRNPETANPMMSASPPNTPNGKSQPHSFQPLEGIARSPIRLDKPENPHPDAVGEAVHISHLFGKGDQAAADQQDTPE
ncbi:MAG: hypothetical protein MZU84_07060 [Sphingobacterium sp.]|nr:hypothetical protein [Sphingobacterium sp.]